MRKFCFLIAFIILVNNCFAQQPTVRSYTRKNYRMETRDGIKLYTVVYTPADAKGPFPILIQRTPYGADNGDKYDLLKDPYLAAMASEGYIFVFQDIRGKFKSEGKFEMNRPLYHLRDKNKTDESTDAWDATDWMVKNLPSNNGKVGIFGISYLGYTALDAISDPHPALKASSPQASPSDMFLGDDFHHNGAFRLSYGFEYSYMVENEKTSNSSFPFKEKDLYNWYLKLGPLKNVNRKYYHTRIPAWNSFVNHPNYDEFWQQASMLSQISLPQIPVMHVGGYYDQEDLNGPQIMYEHLEKKDSSNRNFLVLGPWFHGGWARSSGDSLGSISFKSKTSVYFQQLQKQWFDYWLKGIGDGKFAESTCFQTGSNEWKSYEVWPPRNTQQSKLFLQADKTCTFANTVDGDSSVSYVSDPANPVPYRTRPIEPTYGPGSRWRTWQVEDQRFVASRPDVISFPSDKLEEPVTVTGDVKAHLFVSSTGTDADFVVKLIDVYPDSGRNATMDGYQFPVAMEVFRARYRKSFERPLPLVPGKADEVVIDLHQIDHVFRPGHRIMIQVQSSWFPVIDRNPQKFVPNIFGANEDDYVKATQTIHCAGENASYIEMPVVVTQP